MRHKLYRAIKENISNVKLNRLIEVDSQYTKINLKGTKHKNMLRYAK